MGIAMMPWKLLANHKTFIFGWLGGYAAVLGPVAGIMICDYFLVRRKHLHVDDLYLRDGLYEYSKGFNWRAIGALVIGSAVALMGLVIPSIRFLYDYSWFVGFVVAFVAYWGLMATSTKDPESISKSGPNESEVAYTRDLVIAKVNRCFRYDGETKILEILDLYGNQSVETARGRVQIAMLKLCEGNLEKLQKLVRDAQADYRNVLAWAEYPEAMKKDTWKMTDKEEVARIRARDRKQYLDWLYSKD
jgi:hypothetical protein